MTVSDLLEQLRDKFDNINKLVTGCWELIQNLLRIWNKPCEHIIPDIIIFNQQLADITPKCWEYL